MTGKFGKFAGFHNNNFISAYDTTSQTISAAQQAFGWKINTTDIASGISITPVAGQAGDKIVFSKAGVYNIQFSAQIVESNASATDLWVWPRINGVDVPNSNTKYTLQGSGEAQVITLNYVFRLNKDDYVQINWTNGTTSSLYAAASSTSPDKPAVPSIILTVWEIGSY